MRRVAICIYLILGAVRIQSQQNKSEMDEQTKTQVKQLRAISETIKACPKVAPSPDKGNGTFYYGPPSNVTWDVKPSSSVRSAYAGHIEFYLPREFSASKKYCARNESFCAQMMLVPSFQYRFEFDLGTDGLELMKTLAKSKEDKEWNDVSSNSAGLNESCWLKAARTGETKQRP
jgi:hypothetical protein